MPAGAGKSHSSKSNGMSKATQRGTEGQAPQGRPDERPEHPTQAQGTKQHGADNEAHVDAGNRAADPRHPRTGHAQSGRQEGTSGASTRRPESSGTTQGAGGVDPHVHPDRPLHSRTTSTKRNMADGHASVSDSPDVGSTSMADRSDGPAYIGPRAKKLAQKKLRRQEAMAALASVLEEVASAMPESELRIASLNSPSGGGQPTANLATHASLGDAEAAIAGRPASVESAGSDDVSHDGAATAQTPTVIGGQTPSNASPKRTANDAEERSESRPGPPSDTGNASTSDDATSRTVQGSLDSLHVDSEIHESDESAVVAAPVQRRQDPTANTRPLSTEPDSTKNAATDAESSESMLRTATPVTAPEQDPVAATAQSESPQSVAGTITPHDVSESEHLTIEHVTSFETFLMFLKYCDGAFKPLELRSGSDSRAALASAVNIDRFDDEIRAIATGDVKLASTLALLVTADRSSLTGTPRSNMTALAARVLQWHPAFADDDVVCQRLTSILTGEDELDTLSRLVTRLRNMLDRPFEGREKLKPPALQVLQDNAVHAAVLIAASAGKWDLGTCVAAVADNVWDTGTGFADTVAQREKLIALPKSTRKTAGLLVEVARARIRGVEQERDSAMARVDIARAESQQLAERLDIQARRTVELEAELAAVRAEQEAQAAAHRSERMGSTTDFETLRVELARTISKQIESLEDAVDALEHGQSQITKEFVGRSVNTLRVSLSSLQPRTAHDSQGETA